MLEIYDDIYIQLFSKFPLEYLYCRCSHQSTLCGLIITKDRKCNTLNQ